MGRLSGMSFARRQRAALAHLLDELGPFAPTKCEGWRTQELAAHLYIREHRPLALPGIGSKRFSEQTRRIQVEALHTLGYPALVQAIRSPGWVMRPLDRLVNTSELFIHHEDVLRANDRHQSLTAAEQQELWPIAAVLGRRTQFRFGHQIRVTRSDTGAQAVWGTGARVLHLVGLPSELLLHLSGRDGDVTVTGEPADVERWDKAISSL